MNSPGKTTVTREVDISFRKKFSKQKDFWLNLGQLFVKMAAKCSPAELEALKDEFPNAFEFIEVYT